MIKIQIIIKIILIQMKKIILIVKKIIFLIYIFIKYFYLKKKNKNMILTINLIV